MNKWLWVLVGGAVAIAITVISIWAVRPNPPVPPTASQKNLSPATDPSGKVPDAGSLSLLVGFDSVRGQPVGQCVERKNQQVKLRAIASGEKGSLRGERVSNRDVRNEATSMSAAGSLGLGIFSADASVGYSNNSSISDYSDYFRISEVVHNAKGQYDRPDLQLTKAAKHMVDKGDLVDFLTQCGDQFVIGVITGGAFEAVFRTIATTNIEQKSLAANLNASAFFGSISAEGKQTLQSMIDNKQVSYTILREGAHDEWPVGSIKDLEDYAKKFSATVFCSAEQLESGTCQAVPEAYVMASYTDLDAKAGFAQETSLDHLASYMQDLRFELAGLTYIRDHSQEFGDGLGPFDAAQLATEIHQVTDAGNEAYKTAAECAAKHLRQCSMTEKEIELPKLPQRAEAYQASGQGMSPQMPPSIPPALEYKSKLPFHLSFSNYESLPLFIGPDDERVLVIQGKFLVFNVPHTAEDGSIRIQITDTGGDHAAHCYRYNGPILIPENSTIAVKLPQGSTPFPGPIGFEPMAFTYTPISQHGKVRGVATLSDGQQVQCQEGPEHP